LCIVASAGPRSARADESETKRACLVAFDRAQQMRASTKLLGARDALIECSSETCPTLVRRDCSQWMGEVLASLPSVVFGAQDASGTDLVAVRVSVDGVVAQERLEGKAIAIDPGPHVIRYELTDGTAVEDRILVREGEKNRALTAKFPEPARKPPGLIPSPTAPAPAKLATHDQASPAGASRPSAANLVVGIVSGVAGLGVLGAALAFDLTATSEAHALACAAHKSCQAAQVDPIQEKYTDADILLGAGAAAVVFAVIVLAVRPFHTKATPSSLRLDFSRAAGTAALELAF
jgi:hypothetical protein